jgi:hypothetical protein
MLGDKTGYRKIFWALTMPLFLLPAFRLQALDWIAGPYTEMR